MQQYSQGLACSDRAIQFNQNEPAAWAERAVSNLDLGNFRSALGDSDQALSLDPQNSKALNIKEKAATMMANNPDAAQKAMQNGANK